MPREFLTANKVFQINPAISTNAATGQFPSMQDAYTWAQNNLDCQGHRIEMHLSTGTHHVGLNPSVGLVGGNQVFIKGTAGTKIITSVGGALTNAIAGLHITMWNVALGGAASTVGAWHGGRIVLGNGDDFLQHSNVVFEELGTKGDHMVAAYGGIIEVKSNYVINGGCSTHLHAYSGGQIVVQTPPRIPPGSPPGTPGATNVGVTLNKDASGNNLKIVHFIGVADAGLVARDLWVGGTADCKTYLIWKNGFADLGAAHLPGTNRELRKKSGGVVFPPPK